MSATTTAAVVRPGTGAFAWEEIRLDALRADEVLVRIVGAGICHTDLAVRDGHVPLPLPAVLGHEGAGVVQAVGDRATRVAPGDTVLLSFSSCGACRACAHGRPGHCDTFLPRNASGSRADGTSPLAGAGGERLSGRFFGQSSFAALAIADERCAIPVEVADEDELALLAPVGCGVQSGAGAVLNVLRPQPGDTLAVFGTGAVGLSAVMAAALTAAVRVIAVDLRPARLALARELGATDTIDAGQDDVAGRLAELTGGRGVSHAVESSGVPSVLRQAVDALAIGGTAAVLGLPPAGSEVAFDVNTLLSGRTVRGVYEGDSDLVTFIPALVALHRAGRLPFDRLIRTYPPERINEAADAAARGEVVKPVLRFPAAPG
ncbi:NAD(P)-dependent alcohol dehydrogenase [Streptomyces xiamenensis]|uniref:NAD(P)-dependent alcohol dehydrogenase n=1 Tax=Streptomyces xiamenensis TaxID=408015 RepID=UPI0037D7650F